MNIAIIIQSSRLRAAFAHRANAKAGLRPSRATMTPLSGTPRVTTLEGPKRSPAQPATTAASRPVDAPTPRITPTSADERPISSRSSGTISAKAPAAHRFHDVVSSV